MISGKFISLSVSLLAAVIYISGCGGGYNTYGSTQGVQSSLDGQRNSPTPDHLERQSGERRAHLTVRVRFVQQAIGMRGSDDLCLFINDERIQKRGWVKEFNFPGTPYDLLYYDKTVRPGRYCIKFYDSRGEEKTTSYEFGLEQGKWYTLYITIKNNRHFYSLKEDD